MLDHHFLVTISHAAFVPRADRRWRGETVPVGGNIPGAGLTKHEAFEQRIRREPVCTVQPRLGHFARRIKPCRIGPPVKIHQHPATGVMLRGNHRDRLLRDVDAQTQQLFINIGEMLADKFGRFVADVEVNIIKPEPLDFMVNGARHNVARGQFFARVETWHEAFARGRDFKVPALTAHGLGNQEILDFEIVETGRVELHEFHVRHAAARPPRHRNAVARRAARGG